MVVSHCSVLTPLVFYRSLRTLPEDFAQLEMELELSRRVARRSGGRSVTEILDEQGEPWPGDGDELTPWEQTGQDHGAGSRGSSSGPGDLPRPGPTAHPGSEPGAKKSIAEGKRKQRRAVFSIDYENATAASRRSRYERDTKTIFINLDHPQIASSYEAGGGRIESRQFRAICYEVAAVEYALALPYEKLEHVEMHATEVLFDVVETINRITRRFVELLQM